MSAKLQTCIYCRAEKPPAEFSTEHVIPDAFRPDGGGGWRDNLTLPKSRGVVCRECNQHYGDTIDRAFTRDSYEAFLRLQHRAKPAADVEDLFASRVKVTLPPEGPLGPLKVELGPPVEGAVEPQLKLQPQVRVRDRDGNYVCLLEGELERLRSDDDLDKSQIGVFCSSEEDEERLLCTLRELGFPLKDMQRVDGLQDGRAQVEVELQTAFDQAIARCVAKIGFNYLAWHLGPHYVLDRAFDRARRFIRYGEGHWREFVAYTDSPILSDDSERIRTTQGHLVKLSNAGTRNAIRAWISLYNDFTYMVSLSNETPGVWRRIRSGHHFGVDTGNVQELFHTNLVVPRRHYPVF